MQILRPIRGLILPSSLPYHKSKRIFMLAGKEEDFYSTSERIEVETYVCNFEISIRISLSKRRDVNSNRFTRIIPAHFESHLKFKKAENWKEGKYLRFLTTRFLIRASLRLSVIKAIYSIRRY